MIRFLIGIPVTIAVIIIGLTLFLQPNSLSGCGDQPTGIDNCQKVDAIVAVSGGNTNARTDSAIALYKNGWADTLVFSGAAQDKTGLSNAAAMKQRAISEGVPAQAILIEEYAETTQQNATNSQSIFEKKGYHKIILVTSGYHQRRASLEFNKRTNDVVVLNHPADDQEWTWYWWVTPRGWWLAGGEFVKIMIFYVQGVTG